MAMKRKSYLLGTIVFNCYENGEVRRVDRYGYEKFYCKTDITDRRELVKHIRKIWNGKRNMAQRETERNRRY